MSLISLVILDDIEVPDGLSSKFNADKIDKAAQNIIALSGLIRPLILQRLDYESYKLVSGEFELAAMLRAQEMDSNKERVECFVCGQNTLLGDLDETYLHEAVELFIDSNTKENSSKEATENVELKAENETLEIQIDELQDRLDRSNNKENSSKQMSDDAIVELREQVQRENDEDVLKIATMRNEAIVEIEEMKSQAFGVSVVECDEKMDEAKQEIAQMKKSAESEIEQMRHEAKSKLLEDTARERARLAGMYKPKASHVRQLMVDFISLEGEVSVKEVWLHLAEKGLDFERRQVGQRLAYLNKKGLVERVARGTYSIAN